MRAAAAALCAAGRSALGTVLVAALGACLLAALTSAAAQSLPDPDYPDLRPELSDYRCEERGGQDRPEPASEAERERFAMRARYREYFPAFLARVGHEPAEVLIMPVDGVTLGQIADTWGAPRWDRSHEGVDIFAPRGTPVLAATDGVILSVRHTPIGGKVIWMRPDGEDVELYYAHLDRQDVRPGERVRAGDQIGLVGNTGNARGTSPHLHFGVYRNGGRVAINPEPWLERTSPVLVSGGN